MIVASITRQGNTKNCGWEYLDFPDMEYFLDWVTDVPNRDTSVGSVWEFSAGKPWEVKDWEAQLADLRRSTEADARHVREYRSPSL